MRGRNDALSILFPRPLPDTSLRYSNESQRFEIMQDWGDGECSEETCAICIDIITNNRVASGYQCQHTYHYDCLMDWMKHNHDDCPQCRRKLWDPQVYQELVLEQSEEFPLSVNQPWRQAAALAEADLAWSERRRELAAADHLAWSARSGEGGHIVALSAVASERDPRRWLKMAIPLGIAVLIAGAVVGYATLRRPNTTSGETMPCYDHSISIESKNTTTNDYEGSTNSESHFRVSDFLLDTPNARGRVELRPGSGGEYEELTLTADAAFNTWRGQRGGAPFAFVVAPNSNHYSATVEMKIDNRENRRQIGLFGIYDAENSGILSFQFGPRTWSGAGIGVQTDGKQDYSSSNSDLLESSAPASLDITEWQKIRFTVKPLRLVDFEWFDADSSEWIMFHKGYSLASGYHGSSLHGEKIFVGLKTGEATTAKLHVRNLVVTTYDGCR